jgi:hypothetical protein
LGFSYARHTKKHAAYRQETLPALKNSLPTEALSTCCLKIESMIRAYLTLQYNRFLKGEQRKIQTYGHHEGAKLFAAINSYKAFLQEHPPLQLVFRRSTARS